MSWLQRFRGMQPKEQSTPVKIQDLEVYPCINLEVKEDALVWTHTSGEAAVTWVKKQSLPGLTKLQRLVLLQSIEGGCAVLDGASIKIANFQWFLLSDEERKCLIGTCEFNGFMSLKARGMLYEGSFCYELTWQDVQKRTLPGAQRRGCMLYYGTNLYVLNQKQFEACLLIEQQNLNDSRNEEKENLRRFAQLKEISDGANIIFDRYLQNEEAIYVDRIGVYLKTKNSDEVIIEPLLHGASDEAFNLSFNKNSRILHRYDLKNGQIGRRRIILSEKAEEGLRQIKDVCAWSQQQRKSLLECPSYPFDPDVIAFEDIKLELYSDRIAGIIEHEKTLVDSNPFRVEWFPEVQENCAATGSSNNVRANANEGDTNLDEQSQDPQDNHQDVSEKMILAVREIDEWNDPVDKLKLEECLPNNVRESIQLLPHQSEGVAWLRDRNDRKGQFRGGLLADDMGLGKTLQVLTYLMLRRERLNLNGQTLLPDMVVAPIILLETWLDEMHKFFINVPDCLVLHGTVLKKLRKTGVTGQEYRGKPKVTLDVDVLQNASLILTTYDTVRDYQYSLGQVNWGVIIADEAQKVKNPQSLSSLALRAMKAEFRIACTATPVENSLMDLWSISDFALPGLLGKQQDFRQKYCSFTDDSELTETHTLRKSIQTAILRRLKGDILENLPAKEERTIRIPLSSTQRKQYVQALRSRGNGSVLKLLQELKAICSCATSEEGSQMTEELFEQSNKLSALIQLVQSIADAQEKVIIFTERKSWQRLIAASLEEHFSIPIYIINGDVPGAGSSGGTSRKFLIDEFKSKQGFAALVLSPIAAGYGITITEANHVIHFSRLWNPAKEDQATDRAYRIGQTKKVYVYYLVSTDHQNSFITFDERLDELLQKKRRLAGDVLTPLDKLEVRAEDFTDILAEAR